MPLNTPAEIAHSLGLTVEETPTVDNVKRAILRELRDLQEAHQTPEDESRRLKLMEALSELEQRDTPSTDLVQVPAELITAITRLAENLAPRAEDSVQAATRKMEDSRASLRLNATKDFRNSRTLPFTGAIAAIVVVWGLREPLGVGALVVPTEVFLTLAVVLTLLIISVAWLAFLVQHRDERILDELYNVELQEIALAETPSEFGIAEFEHRLVENLRQYHPRRVFRTSYSPLALSKVDLRRALRDAAILGIERFIEAGYVRRVRVGLRTGYQIVPYETDPAVE
ncbi:hypothetical protein MT356_20675 [Rathayibacter festucae]|uniref:hypothetical protein n=1 Tax=Rathayibacter festucae TaxID=110937 RepID=UPI001FB4204F|nr:hypothetical protein [Rathayibacter festucae]MCJ1702133.1 hypothetical protein [Rathayibacter festucae]